MNWQSHYLPPNKNNWQGRPDTPKDTCFFQKIKLHNLLQPLSLASTLSFALLGFKSDEGVRRNFGREGAAKGPENIRAVFAKLPFTREAVNCYDMGDILCIDGELEKAQLALAEVVSMLIKANYVPILLGGGHEIAWGHYQGLIKANPTSQFAIVNFDSHFDMRPLTPHQGPSSGTPFLQIAEEELRRCKQTAYYCLGIQPSSNIPLLFETAKKYKVSYLLADDFYLDAVKPSFFVNEILDRHDHFYVSLCLDVFATPYAPGVSAPQALGLTPWHLIPLIRQLASSGKAISYDIAELAPQFDIDERTAKLAAAFIGEIIAHHQHNKTPPL